jgi:hypothetical membrane protein
MAVKTRALLLCGAIAGPLFTVAWIIEGAVRPDYNALRYPISSLALGEFGWTQVASFLVTGLLMLVFAIGLQRAIRSRGGSIWGLVLVGAIAIGFLGAGIFATDPLNGNLPVPPINPCTTA